MRFNYKIKYSKEKCLNLSVSITQKANKQKENTEIIGNRDYDKLFCIGFGKTGTTSLEYALKKFGFELGNQAVGELFVEDWYYQRYDRIINYCHTAHAFQDLPFGLPGLYKILDKHFPKSKFILTIRDNAEQWYNSLVNFHSKLFADGKRIPAEKDLANAIYRYKGFVLDSAKMVWNYPETPLYDKKQYIEKYEKHNKDVMRYFNNREGDLFVLNVSEAKSYQKLASFLSINVGKNDTFPWLNKTNV